MHKFYVGVLFIFMFCSKSFAQRSNTTHQFYDSLHIQVSTKLKTQQLSIVVQSFPDSGYFTIW
jgi:hypothetical protein